MSDIILWLWFKKVPFICLSKKACLQIYSVNNSQIRKVRLPKHTEGLGSARIPGLKKLQLPEKDQTFLRDEVGELLHFPGPSHLAMWRCYSVETCTCLLKQRFSWTEAFKTVHGVRIQSTTCHTISVIWRSSTVSLQKNITAFLAARTGADVGGWRWRALVSPPSVQGPTESSFFKKKNHTNKQTKESLIGTTLRFIIIRQDRKYHHCKFLCPGWSEKT